MESINKQKIFLSYNKVYKFLLNIGEIDMKKDRFFDEMEEAYNCHIRKKRESMVENVENFIVDNNNSYYEVDGEGYLKLMEKYK